MNNYYIYRKVFCRKLIIENLSLHIIKVNDNFPKENYGYHNEIF